MRILNAGCGFTSGGTVNLDITPRPVPRFVLGDIRSLPENWTGRFDEVRCFHTLEHLDRDDVAGAVRELIRVLKSRGKLWIRVPYRNNPVAMMRRQTTSDTLLDEGCPHRCSFRPRWFHRFFRGTAIVRYTQPMIIPMEIECVWHKP